MFLLTSLQDLVQVAPHEFHIQTRQIVEDKINEKYSNKIIPKVGLGVCMWDLQKCSDGMIGFGTGNANLNVEFRLVVFRPFKGEVLAARIKSNALEGIYLTTEFFDNIFVPSTMLFDGCTYDQEEKTWKWDTGDSEIFFDDGTIVHARVENELWQDATQTTPAPDTTLLNGSTKKVAEKHPYTIIASMSETGLGGTEWW